MVQYAFFAVACDVVRQQLHESAAGIVDHADLRLDANQFLLSFLQTVFMKKVQLNLPVIFTITALFQNILPEFTQK